MQTEFEKIEKRPIRYMYEDGLLELSIGAVGIFLGGYFWVRVRIPLGSNWLLAWALGLIPLLLIVILFLDLAVKAVRNKLTYPRTGFVSYRKPASGRKRKVISGLITFTWSLIFIFLRSDAPPGTRAISWIPLLTGLFFAGTSIWIGIKTSVPRFYFMAAISALAGIVLSVTVIEENAAFGFYWGILGLSFCLSGVFALLRYIHRHPAAAADPS